MRRRAGTVGLAIVLLLTLGSTASAQVTADVTLRNGRLVVARDSTGAVHLWLEGARRFGLEWVTFPGTQIALGAAATVMGLRAQATRMPADTQETIYRTAYARLILRCDPAVCWATITEHGRGGYWRPAPDFPPTLLLKLAAAIDAAVTNTGVLWRETLP